MDDFENESLDNEFEIEFSDLPTGEARSVSGKLVTQSSQLLTGLQKFAGILAYQGTHLLSQTRTWLLTEAPRQRVERSDSGSDFELEIADLPMDEQPGFAGALAAWGERLSRKARLRRLVMIGCTVLLLLLLILGGVPTARAWTYNLLLHSLPAPAPTNDSGVNVSATEVAFVRVAITERIPGGSPPNGWTNGSVSLGPAPQSQDCSASPIMNTFYALGVGGAPVWVSGFEGPYATLHLSPDPVPVDAFSGAVGWTAIVQVQVADDYLEPITLSGSQDNGTPLLFSLLPPQEQLISITLDPRQPELPSSNHQIQYRHKTAWNVMLYFPTAGCYSLTASWPGGQWHINFTAGL